MFIKNTIFARKFLHILMIFTLVGFSFNVYSEDVAEEVTEIEDKLEEEEDQDNANNDVEALKEIYVRALKVHTELNPERKSELEAEIINADKIFAKKLDKDTFAKVNEYVSALPSLKSDTTVTKNNEGEVKVSINMSGSLGKEGALKKLNVIKDNHDSREHREVHRDLRKIARDHNANSSSSKKIEILKRYGDNQIKDLLKKVDPEGWKDKHKEITTKKYREFEQYVPSNSEKFYTELYKGVLTHDKTHNEKKLNWFDVNGINGINDKLGKADEKLTKLPTSNQEKEIINELNSQLKVRKKELKQEEGKRANNIEGIERKIEVEKQNIKSVELTKPLDANDHIEQATNTITLLRSELSALETSESTEMKHTKASIKFLESAQKKLEEGYKIHKERQIQANKDKTGLLAGGGVTDHKLPTSERTGEVIKENVPISSNKDSWASQEYQNMMSGQSGVGDEGRDNTAKTKKNFSGKYPDTDPDEGDIKQHKGKPDFSSYSSDLGNKQSHKEETTKNDDSKQYVFVDPNQEYEEYIFVKPDSKDPKTNLSAEQQASYDDLAGKNKNNSAARKELQNVIDKSNQEAYSQVPNNKALVLVEKEISANLNYLTRILHERDSEVKSNNKDSSVFVKPNNEVSPETKQEIERIGNELKRLEDKKLAIIKFENLSEVEKNNNLIEANSKHLEKLKQRQSKDLELLSGGDISDADFSKALKTLDKISSTEKKLRSLKNNLPHVEESKQQQARELVAVNPQQEPAVNERPVRNIQEKNDSEISKKHTKREEQRIAEQQAKEEKHRKDIYLEILKHDLTHNTEKLTGIDRIGINEKIKNADRDFKKWDEATQNKQTTKEIENQIRVRERELERSEADLQYQTRDPQAIQTEIDHINVSLNFLRQEQQKLKAGQEKLEYAEAEPKKIQKNNDTSIVNTDGNITNHDLSPRSERTGVIEEKDGIRLTKENLLNAQNEAKDKIDVKHGDSWASQEYTNVMSGKSGVGDEGRDNTPKTKKNFSRKYPDTDPEEGDIKQYKDKLDFYSNRDKMKHKSKEETQQQARELVAVNPQQEKEVNKRPLRKIEEKNKPEISKKHNEREEQRISEQQAKDEPKNIKQQEDSWATQEYKNVMSGRSGLGDEGREKPEPKTDGKNKGNQNHSGNNQEDSAKTEQPNANKNNSQQDSWASQEYKNVMSGRSGLGDEGREKAKPKTDGKNKGNQNHSGNKQEDSAKTEQPNDNKNNSQEESWANQEYQNVMSGRSGLGDEGREQNSSGSKKHKKKKAKDDSNTKDENSKNNSTRRENRNKNNSNNDSAKAQEDRNREDEKNKEEESQPDLGGNDPKRKTLPEKLIAQKSQNIQAAKRPYVKPVITNEALICDVNDLNYNAVVCNKSGRNRNFTSPGSDNRVNSENLNVIDSGKSITIMNFIQSRDALAN